MKGEERKRKKGRESKERKEGRERREEVTKGSVCGWEKIGKIN